ncbi:uncharacterized protein LOC142224489 [Haematobia irritans]|uniref:uncharacterized protein LOC142224489 n=1 Tax=Haematobia irritans TaxID=7368 RepID=UPI003F4F6D4F
MNKSIDFTAFADDFNIIVSSNKQKNPRINLNETFNNIQRWSVTSGASLSSTKCKFIHICRKQSCVCLLESSDYILNEANSLRILGLHINKRYSWSTHIDKLIGSLQKHLNIIKCLACKSYNCSTDTLISIVNALILSRIRFTLPFYGSSPKSYLNKINTVINSALRLCFGAFRTTPTSNLYIESNILPLTAQFRLSLYKQARIYLYEPNDPLRIVLRKCLNRKKVPRIPSVIYRVTEECKKLGLFSVLPKTNRLKRFPPWFLMSGCVDLTLSRYNKLQHNPILFETLHKKSQEDMPSHEFLYTDASKSQDCVSYSVVGNQSIWKTSILPNHTSTFTAELIAIFEAIKIVSTKRGKFAICSDSLSALKRIRNITANDFYTDYIRSKLIDKHPKIVLIWTPGHCNITGNEFADNVAKQGLKSPLIGTENFNLRDSYRFVQEHLKANDIPFLHPSPWYRSINPSRISIKDYLNSDLSKLSRLDLIKIFRLRLGHTLLSHGHLINAPNLPSCNCNVPNRTLDHIMRECNDTRTIQHNAFKGENPISFISNPTTHNPIFFEYIYVCSHSRTEETLLPAGPRRYFTSLLPPISAKHFSIHLLGTRHLGVRGSLENIAVYLAGKSKVVIVRAIQHSTVNKSFMSRTIPLYRDTGNVTSYQKLDKKKIGKDTRKDPKSES